MSLITWFQFWFFDAYALLWFVANGHFAPYDTDPQATQYKLYRSANEASAIIDAVTLMLIFGLQLKVTLFAQMMILLILSDFVRSIVLQIRLSRQLNRESN